MRKLITITVLLSLIGFIRLTGQNVPMLVAGKVHVSGPLYSQGAVHMDTVTVDTAMIDIDNGVGGATAIVAADTIIFYSNDTFEGLLRNLNDNGGGVEGATASQPKEVIVRKIFTPNKYTYLAIPFAVSPSSILQGGTNLELTRGVIGGAAGSYYVWGFDAQARSTNQGFDTASGVWINKQPLENLDASMGYQFWYNDSYGPTDGVVDFVTNNQTDIQNLFLNASKSVNYTMYRTQSIYYNTSQETMDAGWAFIGGINSTVFNFSPGNFSGNVGRVIYYRNSKNSQATNTQTYDAYDDYTLGLADDAPNVGPYSPFYVQGSVGTPGTTSTAQGSATFNPNGLLLDDITFRSSDNEGVAPDELYFALSSDKDNSFDRFYLTFDNSYSESYQVPEDGVKMSTAYDERPAVWSLLDGATNAPLVLNGLPMKDNREVQMGFSVPEAGNYTLSLSPLKNQDVRNVILVDNTTGKKVDLLQESSYSFNTSAVEGENGRFVLYINSSYTGTPTVNANDPYAYAKDNLLTVKNLTIGDKVQILDLAGRTIAMGTATGNEFSITVAQKGVYVVNVKGEKASVLKVLNK